MTSLLLTAIVFATPWLYVRSGQRLIADLGVDPDKNRNHPWKVPPAELALLGAGLVGWVAALGLSLILSATFGLAPVMPDWLTLPEPTVYYMPIV